MADQDTINRRLALAGNLFQNLGSHRRRNGRVSPVEVLMGLEAQKTAQANSAANTRYQNARAGAIENPAPAPAEYGTKEVKVGDQIKTFLTVNGVPTQEIAAGGRWNPAGGQTINVNNGQDKFGAIPQGYELKGNDTDGWTMTPVPGGPADREIKTAAETKKTGDQLTATAANTVIDDITRAEGIVQDSPLFASGLGAAMTGWFPTSPGHRNQMMIDSIKGNIGVDSLLKIKKSGAGLGHIPQSQLDMLAGLLGKLDKSMTDEDLLYNFGRIKDIYSEIYGTVGGDPNKLYGAPNPDETPPDAADEDQSLDDLLKQYQ